MDLPRVLRLGDQWRQEDAQDKGSHHRGRRTPLVSRVDTPETFSVWSNSRGWSVKPLVQAPLSKERAWTLDGRSGSAGSGGAW
jgi:hypothetical protein